MKRFDDAYFRGITIRANPQIIFRWLCQLRLAPYSYDWIDNCGQKSPQNLTPETDELTLGQEVMRIFRLVHFERNKNLTVRIRQTTSSYRIFGDVAISYVIVQINDMECRLLVKFVCQYPRGLLGILIRFMLPWGDLLMMRRQLLNFKWLSEDSKVYEES